MHIRKIAWLKDYLFDMGVLFYSEGNDLVFKDSEGEWHELGEQIVEVMATRSYVTIKTSEKTYVAKREYHYGREQGN